MDEKQRMLAGKLYQPGLDGLREEIVESQLFMHRYNQLSIGDQDKKRAILEELLGRVGESVVFRPPFYIDFGSNITVGDCFFANYNCTILDTAPITIGDDVMFGPNVSLNAPNHPIHPSARQTGLEYSQPITIEDGVWLGAGATILGGVTIGYKAVVAAGATVTKDVPPMTVVTGTPSKILRHIRQEDLDHEQN